MCTVLTLQFQKPQVKDLTHLNFLCCHWQEVDKNVLEAWSQTPLPFPPDPCMVCLLTAVMCILQDG